MGSVNANVLKQNLAKLFNSQYRLGKFVTVIEDCDSILFEAYKNSVISERRRHREMLSCDRAGFLHASDLKVTARIHAGYRRRRRTGGTQAVCRCTVRPAVQVTSEQTQSAIGQLFESDYKLKGKGEDEYEYDRNAV